MTSPSDAMSAPPDSLDIRLQQLEYSLRHLLPGGVWTVDQTGYDAWEIGGEPFRGKLSDAILRWGWNNYHTRDDWP